MVNEAPDSPSALRDEALASDIERLRGELLTLETLQFQAPFPRPGTLWAAMIPRVVPSIATYGAFEEPL